VPQLARGAGVDGIDVIRRREVQDAANLERRRFDGAGSRKIVDPGQAEMFDVGGIDLGQAAEAAPGVVAVVGRPRIGGRFLDLRDRETRLLGRQGGRHDNSGGDVDQDSHFSVSR
jgi:hypothetical protein